MERYCKTSLTDLELVCVDGALYYSKHGLSAVSDVFEAVFRDSTTESVDTYIGVNALKLVLDYISHSPISVVSKESLATAHVFMYKYSIRCISAIENYIDALHYTEKCIVISLIASTNPDALGAKLGESFMSIISYTPIDLKLTSLNYSIFDLCKSSRQVYNLHKVVTCFRGPLYWETVAGALSDKNDYVKKYSKKVFIHAIKCGYDVKVLEPLLPLLGLKK